MSAAEGRRGKDEAWATVATLAWLHEAQVIRGLLESEGFEVNLPEEHIVAINPPATGLKIRVQVRVSRKEEALEVIQKTLEEQKQNAEPERCPHCGSESIRPVPSTRKNWGRALLGLLFGVEVSRARDRRVCGVCGKDVDSAPPQA